MKRLVKDIIVELFHDWEANKDLVGDGWLVEKVSDGLPFILSDIYDENRPIPINKQEVYTYERWRVKMKTVLKKYQDRYEEGKIYKFNIRQQYATGISGSKQEQDRLDEELQRDSFITVNGKEIY